MKNTSKILLFIDCLLDTRFGVISGISEELAVKTLKLGWRDRITDNHIEYNSEFPMDEWTELYKNRDKNTLATSVMTMIVEYLITVTTKLELSASDSPTLGYPEVVVNTWPYDFSASEKDMLKHLLSPYVAESTKISTVYIPQDSLTPDLIRSEYSKVIMYHFNEWWTTHYKAVETNPIPEVIFYIPTIFTTSKLSTIKDMDMFDEKQLPELIKYAMIRLVGIELLDTQYFSIVSNKRMS